MLQYMFKENKVNKCLQNIIWISLYQFIWMFPRAESLYCLHKHGQHMLAFHFSSILLVIYLVSLFHELELQVFQYVLSCGR